MDTIVKSSIPKADVAIGIVVPHIFMWLTIAGSGYIIGSFLLWLQHHYRSIGPSPSFSFSSLCLYIVVPQVERVVYSTCSIHQIENEDVVSSVLPLASSLGFELATPFPQWQRHGLPVFAGSEHLLRMDPVADKEGFFIALFTKTKILDNLTSSELPAKECR